MRIKHLLDRPCVVCEFHTENGCSKWNCVFEQEPNTEWIPVSERLPEKNTAVLTYISTGSSQTYCLAYWNDVRDGWEEWIGYDLIEKDREYKVLAWMPLPKPYKESEDKE